MEAIFTVVVSLFLIAFNIWRTIKKYQNKNGGKYAGYRAKCVQL